MTEEIGRFSLTCRSKLPIRQAFTLIEVLVVVAIIALLISILLPSLAAVRQQTRRVLCNTNLHTWATSSQQYAQQNKGFIPRDYGYTQGIYVTAGEQWHVCAAEVLSPYLGGPRLPLVPKDKDPFVLKDPNQLLGSDSFRDGYLAPKFLRIPALQCPSFPNNPAVKPVKVVTGETIREQPWDYCMNAFEIIPRLGMTGGNGGGTGLTHQEKVPQPGRLIYMTEVFQGADFDYYGFHDVYNKNHLWNGNNPRMINDTRHPGSASHTTSSAKGPILVGYANILMFDGHAESIVLDQIKITQFTPY